MRLTRWMAVLTLSVLFVQQQASADPIFRITETFVGLSGEDGTRDWIEVTNFGDMNGDTGTLIYDDSSLDPNEGGDLPSFILGPGESAVFLVDGAAASDLDLFESIWGEIPRLGFTSGGGGLGQDGDTAAILLSDGTVVDTLVFPALPADATQTIEDPNGIGDMLGLSMVGVRGAYESNPFFNDNIGDENDMVTLIGSPGVAVPEPAALALAAFALTGVFAGRFRR